MASGTSTSRVVTQKDVAELAGVSQGVASVVLNGAVSQLRVSEETRRRVKEAAETLDYHPNAVARGLARGRMRTFGVLFHGPETIDITNHYYVGILQGVMNVAGEVDYNVSLFAKSALAIERSPAFIRDRRTDGILAIAPTIESPAVAALADQGVPLVAVSSACEALGIPSVDIDNEMGARLAVEHLLELGHRRIAHLMGSADQSHAITRRRVFQDVLDAANVPVRPEYIIPTNYSVEVSYQRTRELLALPHPPTAIFACNDHVAMAALKAVNDAGMTAPGDISIVGFDDIPAASLLSSPLTTVRQPLAQIGEKAARLLLDILDGKPTPPRLHLVRPELMVRGTTGPAPR
jgi:DNA-binding LacI/PurR family transcriptional regulator